MSDTKSFVFKGVSGATYELPLEKLEVVVGDNAYPVVHVEDFANGLYFVRFQYSENTVSDAVAQFEPLLIAGTYIRVKRSVR